ncbi:MAG: transposase [Actinomycetota bacterium]|nr:transposase [Actinomycetota bacterium]
MSARRLCYWHSVQMDHLTGDGIAPLVRPDSSKHDGNRPGWTSGRYTWMRCLLASELGGALYRRRQMIEPVFRQIKFNRKIDRSIDEAGPQHGRSGG